MCVNLWKIMMMLRLRYKMLSVINMMMMMMVMMMNVDDFAIAASSQALITELCDALKKKYTITESDNLDYFLGIHIVQDKGNLYLNQPGHIAKCTPKANIPHNAKPTYLPMRG